MIDLLWWMRQSGGLTFWWEKIPDDGGWPDDRLGFM